MQVQMQVLLFGAGGSAGAGASAGAGGSAGGGGGGGWCRWCSKGI